MREIRIELKSDLCAADGDGYATTVDTDVVVDKHGIPFIPARRLKGCMREAAEYIYGKESETIEKIFGKSGDSKPGSLRIENAKIEDYDSLKEMIISNGFSAARVTDLFTDTNASTSIEESGKALDNSLRFMRFVSQKKIWNNNENLAFCANVEITDEYVSCLENICKALRHIGYKRNRGFGCVKCTLENRQRNNSKLSLNKNLEDEKEYVLTYIVRTEENLMLSSFSSDNTADYISGQAVIGALASAYLNKNSNGKEFDEIFISGNTKFSNLYITDEKMNEYVPVPQIFGKTKQSKKIIDMTVQERGKDIIKPLKSGYINENLEVKKTLTERIYHNNVNRPEDDDSEGGLYVQNCVQSGQLFRGTITGKGKVIKILSKYIEEGNISFGRSKTAQYSGCSIVAAEISEHKIRRNSFSANDKIIYLFESDVILEDEFGNNIVSAEDVCESLGLSNDELEIESALKYKTISGYLSVMRMQRAHVRAVAAGSVLVVKCGENTEIDEIKYIGGRNNEGYGKIRVFKAGALLKDSSKITVDENEKNIKNHLEMKKMFEDIAREEKIRIAAIEYANGKKDEFLNKWNAAFIGRVTLMVEQADSELNLKARIASIKSKNKSVMASDLLKNSANKLPTEIHYRVWDEQQNYLMIILTLAKYFHKEKGKEIK